MLWGWQGLLGVGVTALVFASGCDVHGIVGANASDAAEADGGASGSGADAGGTAATSRGGGASGSEGQGSGGGDGLDGSTTDPFIFDVAPSDAPSSCLAPSPVSCDGFSDDPWHALGVGCETTVNLQTEFSGDPDALYVHEGMLGTYGEYMPREGERMVILSTGRAGDLPRTHAELGCDPIMCPSTEHAPEFQQTSLPVPIDVQRVHPSLDCSDDPELVGKGDCSNTLEDEWYAGMGAYDYAELRMGATVPEGADAFIYEFAFFSAEYPAWTTEDSPWNDMYVAWLESEAWTGNISFDEHGNPISINGVFLDFLDADSPACGVAPCVARQLDGFAMDGHAGTRWLETVAPVRPGEDIEVVFAVFDLSDASVDTAVILDGIHWGCTDQPPLTAPAG